MKYAKDFGRKEIIRFLNQYVPFGNSSSTHVNWYIEENNNNVSKNGVGSICVYHLAGNDYRCAEEAKFDYSFNDMRFIFRKKHCRGLNFNEQEIARDWCRFVYKHLDENAKAEYLDFVENSLMSKVANGTGNKQAIIDFKNEIKYSLPFGSIQFYRDNKATYDRLEENNIRELLEVQKKKNALNAYFGTFGIDLTNIESNNKLATMGLSQSNIDLIQKNIVAMEALCGEEAMFKCLDKLANAYVESEVFDYISAFKELKQAETKVLMGKFQKKADDLIDRVLDIPAEVEQEVLDGIEAHKQCEEFLKGKNDILNEKLFIQNDFLKKTHHMVNFVEFLDTMKEIENTQKQIEIE